jgi:preprotein translocase subunit SecG
MRNVIRWPCKLAAVLAVLVGVLLLLGGGGHLSAVLEARAGQPFDDRFVSLLTTSGIPTPAYFIVIAGVLLWLQRSRTPEPFAA